ncbi:putative leucine-rich repeat receptor-like serine/threonine-protein kinase At2g19230 isoform X2 [Musa acuminata AAA Group]|uniref:putative leucine-rich repeat receptor-like serine/threonine-protein kinase At2g19230 isoform X2 n=1 Tax=Musa acuminata AAA Group TaxID=214697 RepID=UPI0031E0BC6D
MQKLARRRRCFSSRNMAVILLFSILLLFSVVAVHVGGQFTDGLGFISLDCGYGHDAQASYMALLSRITYVSDAPYIDSGDPHNISAVYASVKLPQRYLTVRSFPSGARNCYTFRSMTPRLKYLIVTSFLYGNYDSKNSSSVQFDLHLGVNFWKTITVTNRSKVYYTETIMEATTDLISVCLVNTGRGTPFISSLLLRPLNRTLYPVVNASLSLILSSRFDMGRIGDYVRFPSDPHDRIWNPFDDTTSLTKTLTNLTVENPVDDHFEAPHVVMKTAVVPVNANKLELSLTTEPRGLDEYYAVLHFSELKPLLPNESRQFFVYLGGTLLNDAKPFTPDYLSSSAVYSTNPTSAPTHYNISLVATSDSTLPPILNAVEVFSAMQNTIVPSDSRNVDAMVAIKGTYAVKRNWMGDPCMPKAYAWDGLNCTVDVAGVSRITAVNLSHGALTGEISTSFANLSEIRYLDLSYNKLTGSIPAFLAYLPSLKYLDLANNELSGFVPSSLITKSQNGSLTLRIEGNRNVCFNATSCEAKRKKTASTIIVISCVVPVILLLMLVVLCILKKQQARGRHMKGSKEYTFQIDNRRFTYTELKKITKNFDRVLGKGGFGTVYYGHLENGIKVAVKMLSHTSSEEFVTEAQHLSRVHHRNLVSMIGYCIDGEHLALVYEYMSQGTLKEHLRESRGDRPLSWEQRLRIALEASQGLEYLHTGCKPSLIHRDVKTSNILLNERLEAKISDFGLSKAFEDDERRHVSTKVVGTPGYLDPEYYVKNQLSEKSDVYSFGVVLLELITGQPPILIGSEKIHIVEWVYERLAKGNVEDVVDKSLQGEYDVNCAWKIAYEALNCAMQSSTKRPTMTEVVMQLKERLALQSNLDETQLEHKNTLELLKEHGEMHQISPFEIECASISDKDGPSAR